MQKDDIPYIDEHDYARLEVAIIDLLVGVPLGQALYILKDTKTLLLDMHTVDPNHPRFIAKRKEFSEYAIASDR